ncbi:protein SAAL1 [Protopterus annectens]|uniref:protein SAAL1 n=1 Tax=Protopterus annectens TaxID=7888 RepID=UPI001CF97DF4|nr:protein SAAL1 [Protopterus annectens]
MSKPRDLCKLASMDRNPSPPPSEEDENGDDAIGDTIYSKHWVFSILSKLVEVAVVEAKECDGSGENEVCEELDEELETEICKMWDMSMNEDVALFLQEFNVPEILLGVLAKSRSARLTEICVGILGNMTCFHETCLFISKYEELGEVLLLLLGDSDSQTILETCRLLSTCLSHQEAAAIWTDRIRNQPSVCDNICFVMSSSTNADLLVKVGEVVDKLFDLDEEMILMWIKPCAPSDAAPPGSTEENPSTKPELVHSVLEAAKQLRLEHCCEGLDIYMHILQLLTTVDGGIHSLVFPLKVGQATWSLLYDIICHDLCQPDDPSLIIQEQKTMLASILSVFSAMSSAQLEEDYMKIDQNIPLVGSLMRILQFLEDCQRTSPEGSDQILTKNSEEFDPEEDMNLKELKDICAEFLSTVLSKMSQDDVSEALKQGFLSEKTCITAFRNLLPLYITSVKIFIAVLDAVDHGVASSLGKEFPSLKP